jgi:hypothetical protein
VQQRPDPYFVRLDAPPSPVSRAPVARTLEPVVPDKPHHHRRRRHFHIRPMFVVALLLLGGLGWVQMQPGGVSGQVNKWIDRIRGDVQAAGNTDLRRAADYFDGLYAKDGQYPALTEEQLQNDPNAGFGIGVNVRYCSPRHMELVGLTGGGTVTRLLVDGNDLGEVAGSVSCPPDPSHPAPWKLKGH